MDRFGGLMRARHAAKSTTFIILLLLQAPVAAAEPLGMPTNAQATYDADTHSVTITWGAPDDANGATLTYEVRRSDDTLIYSGTGFEATDSSPTLVAIYTITAYDGTTAHGVAAVALAITALDEHCPIVTLDPFGIHPECIRQRNGRGPWYCVLLHGSSRLCGL